MGTIKRIHGCIASGSVALNFVGEISLEAYAKDFRLQMEECIFWPGWRRAGYG